MGVDYDGVGGIGIEVTDERIKCLVERGEFTQEQWDADPYDCLENFGVVFSAAGSEYSGNTWFYWFVVGKTLLEVHANAKSFLDNMNMKGVQCEMPDLLVISEMYVS